MRFKLLVIVCCLWVTCALGGGLWERLEKSKQARSISPGELELQDLVDLYGAKLFDEAIKECDRAERDPQYAVYEPQILYVHWMAYRRIGRLNKADDIERSFLEQFPRHFLAADMHFSVAMNRISSGEYEKAIVELKLTREGFPDTKFAAAAQVALQQLLSTSCSAPSATR